jgi:hypothetical protein
MVFIITRNKVLIPCDSECLGTVHSVTRNETEFSEIIKFYETANKIRLLKVFFCPKKWFRMDFRVFSVMENWFGTEF